MDKVDEYARHQCSVDDTLAALYGMAENEAVAEMCSILEEVRLKMAGLR